MNYKEIVDNLQVEDVIKLMNKLGATNYEEKENCVIFPTICHNIDENDASMKLYFYKDKKLFVCYTEDGNMSIFNFLKHYYEARNIDYDWYEDIYLVVLDCSNYVQKEELYVDKYYSEKDKYEKRKLKELPEYNESVLDCFIKTYPNEWLNDGISKEAMDKFNIRFSISQNKIIIPHYDVKNRLVGIRGRALNPEEIEVLGKYMPVKIEQTIYKHPLSLNLYGINCNYKNIQKNKVCYLFESEKSVLQFESFSIDNCALAVCGSNFNKMQLNLLMKYNPEEIVICFDKEEKLNEDKYFNKLYGICQKYQAYANFSFIYDRENLLEMKDSPSDKGEEAFNQLLRKRVKVY